jgi:hypothetical protein
MFPPERPKIRFKCGSRDASAWAVSYRNMRRGRSGFLSLFMWLEAETKRLILMRHFANAIQPHLRK